MDKISVIIPIYNAEKYLEKCITSVIMQTYEKIEIILVNDGSTDRSFSICRKFQNEYSNIKVIDKKNEGVVKARREGLNIAEGQWVAFVDSDDTIESTMYSELMNAIKVSDADLAILKNYTIFPTRFENEKCVSAVVALRALCELTFPTSMWCGLYPANIAKNVLLDENIHFLEDFLYNYSILQKVETVALCDGQYYHYTVNENSINHQSINDKRMSCLQIAEKIMREGENYCEEMEPYIPFVIAHCLIANLVILKPNAKKERKYYSILKDYSRKYGKLIRNSAYVPRLYKILTVLTGISPTLVSYFMVLKKLRRKK